ncbi:MAG: DUF3467 domain-containing protein [Acidobacteriota bacterium]|nr:DUF3467 domain-containing protein [Acidobacteriota bacterium]
MSQNKQINFTIVPEEGHEPSRVYSNFCAIAHTPFDITLSFCEVLPLSERDITEAAADHVVRAPVRARIVVPVSVVPGLITALQEHLRAYGDNTGVKIPVH